MSQSVGKTFVGKQQVGRMFFDNKELLEVWFRENRIWNLESPGFINIWNTWNGRLIVKNGQLIAYDDNGKRIYTVKNGEFTYVRDFPGNITYTGTVGSDAFDSEKLIYNLLYYSFDGFEFHRWNMDDYMSRYTFLPNIGVLHWRDQFVETNPPGPLIRYWFMELTGKMTYLDYNNDDMYDRVLVDQEPALKYDGTVITRAHTAGETKQGNFAQIRFTSKIDREVIKEFRVTQDRVDSVIGEFACRRSDSFTNYTVFDTRTGIPLQTTESIYANLVGCDYNKMEYYMVRASKYGELEYGRNGIYKSSDFVNWKHISDLGDLVLATESHDPLLNVLYIRPDDGIYCVWHGSIYYCSFDKLKGDHNGL